MNALQPWHLISASFASSTPKLPDLARARERERERFGERDAPAQSVRPTTRRIRTSLTNKLFTGNWPLTLATLFKVP
ncbi:MAG: hypothetical protein QOE88_1667 [Verrucomicrobiota bacterium]|nr:hypothetical protein [Verrucomicrobiota bacterium]